MKKKAITFLKDFTLTLQDGTTRAFKAGAHLLEEELHEHWYVKAHAAPAEAEAEAPADPKAKK